VPQPDPQDQLPDTYRRLQAELSAAAAAGVAGLMAGVALDRIDESWAAIRDQVVAVILLQQLYAATMAGAYFAGLMRSLGLQPQPEGVVPPLAFTGYTSAGIALPDVVDSTPVVVKVAIQQAHQAQAQAAAPALPVRELELVSARPVPEVPAPSVPPAPAAPAPGRTDPVPQAALDLATRRLARIAMSEVQDAGRGALEAQLRLEPQATGYVRHVTLPACGRCLVLAGRVYTKSTGFLRHPQDDCVMLPVFGEPPVLQSPRDLFHQMTDAQQDKAFGLAGARAIRDNADVGSVLNARRGMDAAGDSYTRTGQVGVRRRRHAPPRLSPQGVARAAGDDTVEYRRLLREHGYLT